MQDPGLDIESPVCDVIFYEGVFFWMIFSAFTSSQLLQINFLTCNTASISY